MKDYFGLDIGSTSVKMVQLSKEKEAVFLQSAVEYNLSPGMLLSDSPQANGQLGQAIGQLLKAAKISTNHAVISIPSNSSSWEIFNFPPMDDDELQFAMKHEVKFRVAKEGEDSLSYWQILKTREDGTREIFLGYFPQYVAEKYNEMAVAGRIKPIGLDIEILSLMNLFKGLNKSFIFIHMGHSYSTVMIVIKGVLKHAETISMGGLAITNSLIKEFNMSAEDALKTKMEIGMEPSKFDGKIFFAIKKDLDPIIEGIKMIKKDPGFVNIPFEGLILSGGSSLVPRINDFFAHELSMKVSQINPWVNIDCSRLPSEKLVPVAPKFSVAIGLALSYL
ncbi:hypothetical protein AUK11_00295 [bacterium CG2_30_37_16]|nr:MAG: hypothetical protein AUK11_00295 [bacterium CG2_30_37_16]PIP30661.1 MAG: hypothetical protein COX25_03660 [bacterium (Candidatus Howlettbacteria) CG23_combo_of_CG06-09_8_20_14_all_37_9]PIX99608.1 MAG: hypothetical protein COZ22_02170 [bacterium (Candidatus Howlettbacteria) CG_4_10_14_3_um_filter_37_10]PJB05405.1 MAG: hypothetical protein CO123_04285 [bacterium (Candidatus Howlettbacteria) CG_4_9_14_3_um_filter_37_10]